MSRRTVVTERDAPPARSAPTNTGRVFLATLVEKGKFDPVSPVRSYDDFVTRYGNPTSWGLGNVWAEVFFREGGNELFVSPVRGPAAVTPSKSLTGTSGATLIVSAKAPTESASGGFNVEVINGPIGGAGTRVIIIYLNGVEVARTPEFSVRQTAIDWSVTNGYVDITAGGGTNSLPIVAASSAMTGGTLDRASITNADVSVALALFSKSLGPGQVVAPDWQQSQIHAILSAHAAANNRFAVIGSVYGSSKGTLLSLGAVNFGGTNASRTTNVLAPWLTLTNNRVCPPSALFCAKAAVTDATESANQAPAGGFGRSTSSIVTGVSVTFSDADQAELETGGVGLAILRNGQVTLDTNRTLVDPQGNATQWRQIGNARFRMQLQAELEAAGEPWEHRMITPTNIAGFDAAISGVMLSHQNAYYPGDNDPGFIVETGPTVNTPETAAAFKFVAAVAYRPAPGAEMVQIYVTKVGVADNLA